MITRAELLRQGAPPLLVRKRQKRSYRFRLTGGFSFTDVYGNELFQKLRYFNDQHGKEFSYRFEDRLYQLITPGEAWVYKMPTDKCGGFEAKHVLYGAQGIAKAQASSRGVVAWTEGEKDTDTLSDLGFAACSGHQGAAIVYTEQAQQLLGVSRVVIFVDNDVPGFYHAALRYKALRAVKFRPEQITFRLPQWGKDVTEHLTNRPDSLGEFKLVSRAFIMKLAKEYNESIGRDHGYEEAE